MFFLNLLLITIILSTSCTYFIQKTPKNFYKPEENIQYPSFNTHSDLNENEMLKFFDKINQLCDDSSNSYKTNENDFFSESTKSIKKKNNSYTCTYNFRGELIQWKLANPHNEELIISLNIYENHPTSIIYFDSKRHLLYTRHWQWIVRRSIWDSTMTFLSFELKEENRKIEYFFSRYSGGLVKKLSYRMYPQKVLDGWNLNHEDNPDSNKDQCSLFENGKIVTTLESQCDFELFDVEINYNQFFQ